MKTTNQTGDTVKENKTGHIRLIYRISLFVLAAFLAFFCLNGLTDWEQADFLFATQHKAVLALLVICCVVLLWTSLQAARLFLERQGAKSLRCIAAVLLTGAALLQLVFLFHYRNLYLFDNAFVTGGASTLATGDGVAPGARYYFSVYPNQNAYIVLTAFLWKLGSFLGLDRGQIPYLLNTVNLLCLDSAFFLLYRTYCAYKKDAAPADRVWFLLLICMNPFLYIGVCYYYTIVLSMPFVMALLYLYIRYFCGEGKVPVRAAVLMSLCFGAGYLLRATTVIPMIAVLFVSIYFRKWKKELLLTLAAAVGCIFLLGRANAGYIGIDTRDSAFPALHWVMMSLTPPGTHNEADEAYTASFATKEEKQEAVKARLAEKLSAMSAADMGRLFVSKLKQTWGSGSNGYTVFLENCVETDGIYEWVFGQHKDICLLYHQGYYLLLLLLFLRQLSAGIRCVDDRAYVWQLTYLGAILFYLLWETGGQYSLPFLPVLMLGAGVGAGLQDAETEAQMERIGEVKDPKRRSERWMKHRSRRWGCALAGMVCLAFLFLFWVRKYPAFTQPEQEWTHPVVTQILANDETILQGDAEFCQEFETDQPFNRIVFQYTNPNEVSQAIYEVRLVDSKERTLLAQSIDLCGAPARNAAIYDFPTVAPEKKESYRLLIRMQEGTSEDRLGIITYSMGHYDAWPVGACLLGGQELEKDMLFAVSYVRRRPYMTRRQYLLAGILMGIILFLPILGILVYTKDWYNQKD